MTRYFLEYKVMDNGDRDLLFYYAGGKNSDPNAIFPPRSNSPCLIGPDGTKVFFGYINNRTCSQKDQRAL